MKKVGLIILIMSIIGVASDHRFRLGFGVSQFDISSLMNERSRSYALGYEYFIQSGATERLSVITQLTTSAKYNKVLMTDISLMALFRKQIFNNHFVGFGFQLVHLIHVK